MNDAVVQFLALTAVGLSIGSVIAGRLARKHGERAAYFYGRADEVQAQRLNQLDEDFYSSTVDRQVRARFGAKFAAEYQAIRDEFEGEAGGS